MQIRTLEGINLLDSKWMTLPNAVAFGNIAYMTLNCHPEFSERYRRAYRNLIRLFQMQQLCRNKDVDTTGLGRVDESQRV
jgi:hypothetical protein